MKNLSKDLLNNKSLLPKLKYYVYAIYLPDKTVPCYIGKGQGDRWRHYFYYPERVANRILKRKLCDLKDRCVDYYVEFLYETREEQDCLDVESFYISYYGRVFNKTGFLYNFDISSPTIPAESPKRRKAVYVDGFVFDSVGRARRVTGIKHETIKKYVEQGRASYLDDSEQVRRVFEREKKLKYHHFYKRHEKAIKRAKKCMLISESRYGEKNPHYGKSTAISKKIIVDGVLYDSISKAAEAHGWKKGSTFSRHLQRGNHQHTYSYP